MGVNTMPRACQIKSINPNNEAIDDIVFYDIGPKLRLEARITQSDRRAMRISFEDAKDLHS